MVTINLTAEVKKSSDYFYPCNEDNADLAHAIAIATIMSF